ncbi:hypothetical protein ILUMI_09154 [Ignelater luminosus]|uniref:Uncharacterized protein n=1 Tax=Ignelater luminosus TaxID=2038154 RepID=A0A8K0D4U1_IGNLU|nr:hypothetical protein ILUMI_09154 [Ignelater luminosus]
MKDLILRAGSESKDEVNTSEECLADRNNQAEFLYKDTSGISVAVLTDATTPVDICTGFLSDHIFQLIVSKTNRNAKQILNENQHTWSSRISSWNPLQKVDLNLNTIYLPGKRHKYRIIVTFAYLSFMNVGTLQKNRKGLPEDVVKAKAVKGDVFGKR